MPAPANNPRKVSFHSSIPENAPTLLPNTRAAYKEGQAARKTENYYAVLRVDEEEEHVAIPTVIPNDPPPSSAKPVRSLLRVPRYSDPRPNPFNLRRKKKHQAMYATDKAPERTAISAEEIKEITDDPDFLEKAFKAVHPETGEAAEYRQLRTSSEGHLWEAAMSDEMGRLAQGNSRIEGTDTIQYIRHDEVPQGEKSLTHA